MLDYEVSPAEAAALLRESKARLIDVREPWEFETAHIEVDPDERLVVLCHMGVRSMSVTVWLRNQGFEQAQSLHGGIDSWSAEIDPAVPRY